MGLGALPSNVTDCAASSVASLVRIFLNFSSRFLSRCSPFTPIMKRLTTSLLLALAALTITPAQASTSLEKCKALWPNESPSLPLQKQSGGVI